TTSPRARSARTESTSSWRSRVGSARRCAWPTPLAHSACASCSAACSNPDSGSRPRRRSRASATTLTSTATCSWPQIRGPASSSATASSFPQTNPASVSDKKYLILAEEFSHDPHYGKTLRGVMRYRRESVVAILDTKRAGETDDGVPIVARVDDALCFNPDTALVGVVTQGGRFPAEWRALLRPG